MIPSNKKYLKTDGTVAYLMTLSDFTPEGRKRMISLRVQFSRLQIERNRQIVAARLRRERRQLRELATVFA